MSAEAAPAAVDLVATARPGVAIRISDANLREIGRGADAVSVRATPGLYMIEWNTAGDHHETLLRIEAGEKSPRVVDMETALDRADAASDRTGEATRTGSPASAMPREELIGLVGNELKPSGKPYESSIAVIVAGDGSLSPVEALLCVRLFNRSDAAALNSNKRDTPLLRLANGEFARCYRVRPGRFHLRFRSTAGDTLGQSVPALAGRQTIVFLRAAKANLMVADGDRFTTEVGVGIDPSRTVMVTVDGNEEPRRIRERIRLAGVLLHDLATGTGSLSREFVDILLQERTDPLLKLYAALVAKTCLDLSRPPALDEPWPTNPSSLEAFSDRWMHLIERWMGEPSQPGMPVDATALWWQLRRERPGAVQSPPVATRIEVPPMLETAWRWAISHSVTDPASVPATPSLLAATRSAGGTTPWLCWKAAASKAAKGAEVRDAPKDLTQLIEVVARKGAVLSSRRDPTADDAYSDLSPDVAATVMRAVQLSRTTSFERQPSEKEATRTDLPEALALSLSLPAMQLRRRLGRAIEELDAALSPTETRSTRKSRIREPSLAPGLLRKVIHSDDPQRGRFGGERRSEGFQISARFQPTSNRDWTRIIIRVNGKAPDGTAVEFHLHDSFKPQLERETFRRGVAELTVTVWGGFTVGVWIPSLEVELELDLAKLRDAPHNIRIR